MPLSYSQLSTYQRCPKQYEFAYVRKIARPISPAESYGSSLHNTLKYWGELEMQIQNPEEINQLTLFMEAAPKPLLTLDLPSLLKLWNENFINNTYPTVDDANIAFAKGKAALTHFFDWWKARRREVVGVEKSFAVEVIHTDSPLSKLSGRLDRVERSADGLHIIDFKSSAPREQEHVDEDLQLSIYAKAAQTLWNEPVASLSLLFLREDQTLEIQTKRSEIILTDAMISIREVIDGIEQQDFTAKPTIEKCKRCPYRSICPDAAA